VLYAASLVYLFHPLYPALDSAHLISLVHSLPTWVKGGIKFVFAVPFTFHTFNGIRHLAWDTGFGESQFGQSIQAWARIREHLGLWGFSRSLEERSERLARRGRLYVAPCHNRFSAEQLLLSSTSPKPRLVPEH
jgi:hypothetical protein